MQSHQRIQYIQSSLTDCHRKEHITYLLILQIQSVGTYRTSLTLQIVTEDNLSQLFQPYTYSHREASSTPILPYKYSHRGKPITPILTLLIQSHP